MENSTNSGVSTLYMAASGVVYRIAEENIVFNQFTPVEIPYAAFIRLSAKEHQVGIDSLLSPNAISGGAGYSSRNIVVINIPGVGMAWCTRISTKVPSELALRLNLDSREIGTDFIFMWSPGKALSAFLAVQEQTRLDSRTRFLSACDPTPKCIFTNWDDVMPCAANAVDPATLTVPQRIFAASFKTMVHLASPRYTIDMYCAHRAKEEGFLNKNAPIKLKYSGLKLLRLCEDDQPVHQDENTTPMMREFTGLFCDTSAHFQRNPLSIIEPLTWETAVSYDVQCSIIEAVVHSALNALDAVEALATLRSVRMVCKSFCKLTDRSVHSALLEACTSAKIFCDPNSTLLQLGGLLLERMWWRKSRIPYISLLGYDNDNPRLSVSSLARILETNSHKAFHRCSFLPRLHQEHVDRKATADYLKKKVLELQVLNARFST